MNKKMRPVPMIDRRAFPQTFKPFYSFKKTLMRAIIEAFDFSELVVRRVRSDSSE